MASRLSAPPTGFCQDGQTARLLPGGPRAPGRAGPRGPLADPAEVAGLLGAPRAREREYPHLPAPSQTPEPGEGHRKRSSKGTAGFCRQEAASGWLAGGWPGGQGVADPLLGAPFALSSGAVAARPLIHSLVNVCCLPSTGLSGVPALVGDSSCPFLLHLRLRAISRIQVGFPVPGHQPTSS